MGTLHTEIVGGIATFRLENGAANAIDFDIAAAIERQAAALAGDPEVAALVVTGSGDRVFCAGSDLDALARLQADPDGTASLLRAERAAFDAIAALDIPTIAAVNGHAIGGGLELALCCDIIIAAERAKFSLPEIALGVFPGLGGTVRLAQRIGHGRAAEMMMLGDAVAADTALAWGLINRAVDKAELAAEANRLAARFAAGPRDALRALKGAMRAGRTLPEPEALAAALNLAIAHAKSPDAAEGFRAFVARQTPDFTRNRG